MPTRRERPGFRFAIADDTGDDKIRIVERRAVGMAQRIAQLATFVNAARSFGRHMAWNPAGEAELFEQFLHSFGILADVGIHLAVSSLKVCMRHKRWASVAGADDVDHVQLIALDDAIQMNVQHVEARRRSPMPEQTGLDVLALKRLF